jgi:hAT family C-terminal dimerisation region
MSNCSVLIRLLDSMPKSAVPQQQVLSSLEAIIKSRPASKGSNSDLDPKKQAEVEYEVHFKSEQPCDFLISPLLWWDTSSSAAPLYPNVKLLARQFTCVPISCVTSKRLNAESADYESCRAQLDYFQIDPMLFLNSNMDMIMPGYV